MFPRVCGYLSVLAVKKIHSQRAVGNVYNSETSPTINKLSTSCTLFLLVNKRQPRLVVTRQPPKRGNHSVRWSDQVVSDIHFDVGGGWVGVGGLRDNSPYDPIL